MEFINLYNCLPVDFLCTLKEQKPCLGCTISVCCIETLNWTLYPKIQPRMLVRILVLARFSVHISLRRDRVNHSGYGVEKRLEGKWRCL